MSQFVELSHDEMVETEGGLLKFLLVGYAIGWVLGRFT